MNLQPSNTDIMSEQVGVIRVWEVLLQQGGGGGGADVDNIAR